MPTLKPKHLSRYQQIARLLFKYGRSDLTRKAGFEKWLMNGVESDPDPEFGRTVVHEHPGDITRRLENGSKSEPEPVETSAQKLAKDLEALGPTFTKVGQFLSTRGDLLSPSQLEALSRLQDHTAPLPFADVERVVMEDLGVRISKAFASFDRTPLASASLGQVHRAELPSGLLVAVKVQRPDARKRVAKDLEVFAEVAEMLDQHTEAGRRQGFANMLEEFQKSLARELDYRQEARHLDILAENLKDFEHLVVPRPVPDFVSSRVLTMEFICGRKVTSLGPLAQMELDAAPLAEELCQAYLRQIFVDGFFHADPHPGNVFLTDDGRLALLDLGMVGQLTPGMQEILLRFILAVSEGRGDEAAETLIRMGTPLPEANPVEVKRRVGAMVVEFQGMKLKEIALGRLLFDVTRVANDHGVRMPRELTLLAKTLLNIDQVARRLDSEFDPNAAVRRGAADLMRHRMLHAISPGRMFTSLLEVKEFAENFPRRLNQLFDAVSENRLQFKVDAIDEVLLMAGLQKIANRITVGLVISAMIIGAAQLMRIETSFRILGYPGIAILFFAFAAVCAIVLVTNIMLGDLKVRRDRVKNRAGRTANP